MEWQFKPWTWLKEQPLHSGGAEVMEGVGGREHHGFQGNLWEAHHLQEENSSDGQSEHSSWHSNQMRVSRESGQIGADQKRLLGWKSICPSLKTKRPKMQWPTTHGDGTCLCFCHSSWDDCHLLLLYVFRSLQGFPGDLARSLVEDATLGHVLDARHWTNIMVSWWPLNTLSKELYSLKQGMGENVAEFRVHAYFNRFRCSRQSIPAECNRSMWRRWSGITSMKALILSTGGCWPTSSMVKILSPILNCSLQPGSWKDGWKPGTPLLLKIHYYWEFEHNSFSFTQGIYFHPGSWRVTAQLHSLSLQQ